MSHPRQGHMQCPSQRYAYAPNRATDYLPRHNLHTAYPSYMTGDPVSPPNCHPHQCAHSNLDLHGASSPGHMTPLLSKVAHMNTSRPYHPNLQKPIQPSHGPVKTSQETPTWHPQEATHHWQHWLRQHTRGCHFTWFTIPRLEWCSWSLRRSWQFSSILCGFSCLCCARSLFPCSSNVWF